MPAVYGTWLWETDKRQVSLVTRAPGPTDASRKLTEAAKMRNEGPIYCAGNRVLS